MNQDVIVKEIAPQWIASIREVIPAYTAVGKLYGELFGALGPDAFGGITVALWHDPEHKERDVDAEAGVFIKNPVEARGRVKVHELPAATVASITHHGAYNSLSKAYEAVLSWIGSKGYRVTGPIRELYLQLSQPVRPDDESYVTEIQVPVEKSGA
jgi:effector-binding domain-containing protein